MRRYLLDTTIVAAGLSGRPAAVELLTPWISDRVACTSILVYGEVVEFLQRRSDHPAREGELRQFLQQVPPYFLTYSILHQYATIRRRLRPPNGPGLIGDVDTLIAATALIRNLTVVTTDGDFERVPGLEVMLIPRHALSAAGTT